MGKPLLVIRVIALSQGMGWWGQLLLVVMFEGGEFVIEPGGGVDLRSGEERWRDRMLITDTTCTENCLIL